MSTTIPSSEAIANRNNVDVEEKVYKKPCTTVDALAVRKNTKTSVYELLVIQRGRNPFKGYWALPGGFIEYGEDPLHAAPRELEEETKLVQLPGSTTFISSPSVDQETDPDDAMAAKWISLDDIGTPDFPLAFDHVHIVDDFRKWFKKEGEQRGFMLLTRIQSKPGETASTSLKQ
ncbi:NUDIX hydrolase domain-like protein [Chytridium lagenaria]|nr:NUDIX hydrolase domain-like protein [Chytridium lagenaria]